MNARRAAFTLIEVLIVVVIMAVLAATIIPQFTASTDDAQKSALRFNIHTLRSQIELYKVHHNGAIPALTAGTLPQLTAATNLAGVIGTPGPTFPFGPYTVAGMPENPFNGLTAVAEAAQVPPTAEVADAGWLYDSATGQIWANSEDYLTY